MASTLLLESGGRLLLAHRRDLTKNCFGLDIRRINLTTPRL